MTLKEVALNSPEAKRAEAEESYWRIHRIDFGRPLRVFEPTDPSADLLSYKVSARKPDYSSSWSTLGTLSPEECRYSCCKDVAIYLNPPPTDKSRSARHLFKTVYRRFFPHRNMAFDLEGGHFFAQIIDFKAVRGGGTLSEVTRFHEALCHKVESELPHLKQNDPRLPEGFGLSSIFKTVFSVIDNDEDVKSAEPNILVVCKDEETAKRLGLQDEEREHDPSAGSAGKSDEDASRAWPLRYRISLIRLMDSIFAIDENRRIGVEPDSLSWKSQILDEEHYKFV